jgi:hypothetical protein
VWHRDTMVRDVGGTWEGVSRPMDQTVAETVAKTVAERVAERVDEGANEGWTGRSEVAESGGMLAARWGSRGSLGRAAGLPTARSGVPTT